MLNDMRRTNRTILLGLCLFALWGAHPVHAQVTLKISASNPSTFEAREIPLKSYLPKGIQPEEVLDAGELEIGYDVKRDQAFVFKTVTLEPQASATFEVGIEDIWIIDQGWLDEFDRRTDILVGDLRDTNYEQMAERIRDKVARRIDEILGRQEANLVFKVGPTEHIAVHDVNLREVAVIEGNIRDLERLVKIEEEDAKTGSKFDKTHAEKLMEAQILKERILNYGDPDLEETCLVDDALRVERQDIILESPETVQMRIDFENPSDMKTQTVPLRFAMPKEVHASDVINANGLNVGFDFERGLYYVYKDNIVLEPSEIKNYRLTLNNKWAVDKHHLYGLKVYLENLVKVADETVGLEGLVQNGRKTLGDIYALLRQTSAGELTESQVASYRSDLMRVEDLRQAVQEIEDSLIGAKLLPELVIMEQEILCVDARRIERDQEDILGLSGILNNRRVRLMAGTIFKGKRLSTADTWKIIQYIILFLGVISGAFYYVNIREQKSVMFDTLTGAFARGYALERLREELKIAKGGGNKCSLLVMDIDKFKGINDNYGHAVGDMVLKEFVIAMRKGVRATDLIGRFGGDEFMIILPTGEKAIAFKIAQSITRIVEGTAIRVNPQLTLSITTSVGVSTYPQDSATAEDLFDKADQALYLVKKRGGNGAEPFGGDV